MNFRHIRHQIFSAGYAENHRNKKLILFSVSTRAKLIDVIKQRKPLRVKGLYQLSNTRLFVLDIKSEVHNIAVSHYIFFTFYAQLAIFAAGMF